MQRTMTIHLVPSYAYTALTSITRKMPLVCGITALLLASGCSLLPGTFVVPDKPAVVIESPEFPVKIDYILFKVTPLLIEQLEEETIAAEIAKKKNLKLPKASSFPYRLGKHDVLRIFVWGNPDLTPVTATQTTTSTSATPAGRVIDENGDLFFPMVGTIHAEGLTTSEFRKALTKRLSKFIVDPQIDVDVAAFRSQKIFVSGQIRDPGIVPVTDQPMLLIDALGRAGGPTENSDLYAVVLTRGKVSITINVDKIYYNGDLSGNVMMSDGDLLTIPDRAQRKIFVLGEVGNSTGLNQARSYIMRRGEMTLTEVLSDAGGVSPFSAAANEVYVMRLDKLGKPVVYQLDASQPQALLMAEKFQIQPRDVIFVNPTGPTLIGRFIAQFLPGVQGANVLTNNPF